MIAPDHTPDVFAIRGAPAGGHVVDYEAEVAMALDLARDNLHLAALLGLSAADDVTAGAESRRRWWQFHRRVSA